MQKQPSDFKLGIGDYLFSDLYKPDRLKSLHETFWAFADKAQPGLKQKFYSTEKRTDPQESEILIEVGSYLGSFLARLFKVEKEAEELKEKAEALSPVFRFKKEFAHLRCYKRFDTEAPVSEAEFLKLHNQVTPLLNSTKTEDPELRFAETACALLDKKAEPSLRLMEDWFVQAYVDRKRRQHFMHGWVSILRPHKLDFENLVEKQQPNPAIPEMLSGPETHFRYRDGFKLTDPRMLYKEVQREVDYCIYCHQREKDSCSKGFPEKAPGKTEAYKKNPLGIPLEGCPLDERISEMHWLQKGGQTLAALAMVMLDNPMCPGTGHRICNDCMKGCIFQKQEPVNIPQNETRVLTDVLNLPYGFEVYSLLTRFNPLNKHRPYALPYNGKNVLVVGLGPAGYTLTHYLANYGFGVVGIDGLKLEPLPETLSGLGQPFPKPVEKFSELVTGLDERLLMGFGGVSEYGITVRWDKNFLAVIYLSLVRRQNTRFYGGVRFGGTVDLNDAWELGFSHVAMATGAGKPTIVPMKNNLIRGIRKASDFLMALQLTGAFKKSSPANLLVRLPAVVIGGGLTAIDTATELMAYYPIQVEKVLEKFELFSKESGEVSFWQMFDEEEKEIVKTFLEHAREIRAERAAAQKENRNPNLIALLRKWGGVSLAYRKRLGDAPAYRLNHEEVAKAFEEGIYFIENMTPVEAKADKFGSLESMVFERANKEKIELPARTACVAAGTSPNTIYEREFPGTFELDEKGYFFQKQTLQESGGKFQLAPATKDEPGFFLSYQSNGRFVSYYGDNHPDYAGNVVKAMASAKHGVLQVAKLFQTQIEKAETQPSDIGAFTKLAKNLDEKLIPRVVRVNRLTPTIVEVVVKGHYVAKKFQPGQFFRLQNYESSALMVDGTKLTMEGLALTGAWVEPSKDELSLIVLEMGGSSRLCATLQEGEPVVVMGPTGTPSEIPKGETVLLIGGGLGNAVLLSIAHALKKNGSKVIYFAGYKNPEDIFKQGEIEAGTDAVIWACDKAPGIPARRPQDISFVGNIVQAMEAYGSGKIKSSSGISLSSVSHLLVIGSDRMMAAVGMARHGVLKPYLKTDHMAIASINSPMQCMMKEVCAQCLQRHVDPKTGKESFVFSCFNQDQEIDCVDFKHLNARLRSNSLLEKMANRHLDYLFKRGEVRGI